MIRILCLSILFSTGLLPARAEEKTPVRLEWNARPGQSWKMTRLIRNRLALDWEDGWGVRRDRIDCLRTYHFLDTVLEVNEGRPVRIQRQVELAEVAWLEDDSGSMKRGTLPLAGMEAEMKLQPGSGFVTSRLLQGKPEHEAELNAQGLWLDLLPREPAAPGFQYILPRQSLDYLEAALKIKGALAAMRFSVWQPEMNGREKAAILDGRLSGRVSFGNYAEGEVSGELHCEFQPETGAVFVQRVQADIQVDDQFKTGSTLLTVQGEGSIELVEEYWHGETSRLPPADSPADSTGEVQGTSFMPEEIIDHETMPK
jgi:hypothetical protein